MVLEIVYLFPILTFILVFVLVYALLGKTEILGSNKFIHSILSLVIAMLFVLTPNARQYTATVTPWITVFLVALFFMILILSFVRGNIEDIVKNPAISFGIIAIILVIFLISGVQIFGSALTHLWNLTTTSEIRGVLTHPSVMGVIILVVIGAIISWFLNK
jgi:hypothetical protein